MAILTKTPTEGISGTLPRVRCPPWWMGFGLCLLLPCSTLAVFATGPHAGWVALAGTLPVWMLIAADRYGPLECRVVPAGAPRGFFDGLLYLLVGLQVLNLIAMGDMVSRLSFATPSEWLFALANLLAVRILMGTNSCCAAIAPAHELIHRRRSWQRFLGRILLMTVGYDHFHIAHKRGHHAGLGGPEDPSTAHPDESYEAFCRRSVLRQWRTAWRSAPRVVLGGMVAELGMLAVFGWAFGALAVFMLIYQAAVAVRLLEAVNYFQHFGLTVDSGRSGATAWASDSAMSLFLFLGLNRHADHHRRPTVPYPELRALADGPRLPYGYLGMALWVKNRNRRYRSWAAGISRE